MCVYVHFFLPTLSAVSSSALANVSLAEPEWLLVYSALREAELELAAEEIKGSPPL